MNEAFYKVNALTQEQRDAAYESARQRIAGRKPDIADYEGSAIGHYPAWVNRIVTTLSLVMLMAAFLPSAMRLHAIALSSALLTLADLPSSYVAALCVVLMAEIGQVIFSVASAISVERWHRHALRLGSLVCLCIALAGNAQAMSAYAFSNAVAFLETFAPPVLVLITANILKSQMLNAVRQRHASQQSYASALIVWQTQLAHADANPAYARTLANVLRDALRSANKHSKAVLRELTNADWLALVERERSAEEWYERASQTAMPTQKAVSVAPALPHIQLPSQVRSGHTNGNATREIADAETTQEGSAFVKHCPVCNRRFEGPTKRSVTNSVVAHQKSHRTEVAQPAISPNGNGTHD